MLAAGVVGVVEVLVAALADDAFAGSVTAADALGDVLVGLATAALGAVLAGLATAADVLGDVLVGLATAAEGPGDVLADLATAALGAVLAGSVTAADVLGDVLVGSATAALGAVLAGSVTAADVLGAVLAGLATAAEVLGAVLAGLASAVDVLDAVLTGLVLAVVLPDLFATVAAVGFATAGVPADVLPDLFAAVAAGAATGCFSAPGDGPAPGAVTVFGWITGTAAFAIEDFVTVAATGRDVCARVSPPDALLDDVAGASGSGVGSDCWTSFASCSFWTEGVLCPCSHSRSSIASISTTWPVSLGGLRWLIASPR